MGSRGEQADGFIIQASDDLAVTRLQCKHQLDCWHSFLCELERQHIAGGCHTSETIYASCSTRTLSDFPPTCFGGSSLRGF